VNFDSSVLKVTTADQFYSAMAHLSVQLLDEKIIDADNLTKVGSMFELYLKKEVFVHRKFIILVHFQHQFYLNYVKSFHLI
jgi:hypothetical protein